MTNFSTDPTDEGVKETRRRWANRTSTPARTYLALLETSDYTHYDDISTIADCDPRTAEKYLKWFVDMGLAQRLTEFDSPYYRRNDAYFEWFEAYNIAKQVEENEIIERIAQFEDDEDEIASQFDTDDPSTFRVPDPHSDNSSVEKLQEISRWQDLKKNIKLYRLAHHLCINDGYIIGK